MSIAAASGIANQAVGRHPRRHHSHAATAATGTATGAFGGTLQSVMVTAPNADVRETEVAARKTEIGARAPFFQITRNAPFVFTVTMLAQLLTLYYFLFFLVILPLLGLRETPGRVPDTIAKSVTGADAGQGA